MMAHAAMAAFDFDVLGLARRLFHAVEPTGRANARPMTGSAKQSGMASRPQTGLLRRRVHYRAARKKEGPREAGLE
jgi:hypothetical protein